MGKRENAGGAKVSRTAFDAYFQEQLGAALARERRVAEDATLKVFTRAIQQEARSAWKGLGEAGRAAYERRLASGAGAAGTEAPAEAGTEAAQPEPSGRRGGAAAAAAATAGPSKAAGGGKRKRGDEAETEEAQAPQPAAKKAAKKAAPTASTAAAAAAPSPPASPKRGAGRPSKSAPAPAAERAKAAKSAKSATLKSMR